MNFFILPLIGQKDSITVPIIEINSTRIKTSLKNTPLSISKIIELNSLGTNLGLQEYLNYVPGVYVQNGNNYAQDLRISIRGFGARSAFGIRGVKLIVDGIPETTPDGQGQLDNVNLEQLKSIEIIKGPAGVLYGNAAGGVVSLTTYDGDNDKWQIGYTGGSYGLSKMAIQKAFNLNKSRFSFNAVTTKVDGYRSHARYVGHNINSKYTYQPNKNNNINVVLNITHSPTAQDPGGVDSLFTAIDSTRAIARDRNILFDAGESITHYKLGISGSYQLASNKQINVYGFASHRSFSGRLPFESQGLIALQRLYGGHGLNYEKTNIFERSVNVIQIGYEILGQRDNRQRYDNINSQKGNLTLDQIESFSYLSAYILDEFSFDKLSISAGLRYDFNYLEVDDNFISNGINNDNLELQAFNPSIGLKYRLQPNIHIYTTFRTSYETPTLSELSADPNGLGGFNTSLGFQSANNIDIGLQKTNGKWTFDITGFYINTDNDLVPFELAEFPGRTFYSNAGSTDRYGIELSSRLIILKDIFISANYTYSHYAYNDYINDGIDLSGNKIPGLPNHLLSIVISNNPSSRFSYKVESLVRSQVYANDENTIIDNGYNIVSARIGYKLITNNWQASIFGGVNNLFSTRYNDNLRINAFGGRFFEPAPLRNIYLGVRLEI